MDKYNTLKSQKKSNRSKGYKNGCEKTYTNGEMNVFNEEKPKKRNYDVSFGRD